MNIARNSAMLLGCMVATPAFATITYVDSQVYSSARADVYANTIAAPSNDQNARFSSVLPTGGISVQSSVDKLADGGSAHASQFASLQANAATSGTFVFNGAISTSLTSPANGTAQALIGEQVGFFRFYTDTPVFLDLNYAMSGKENGVVDPATAVDIAVGFYNNGIVYDQQFAGTGSLQILLQSGDYDIFTGIASSLSGKPTFINANGLGDRSNAYDGTLKFAITATTPEPASWAMMIAGLGLIGTILRRRSGAYGAGLPLA